MINSKSSQFCVLVAMAIWSEKTEVLTGTNPSEEVLGQFHLAQNVDISLCSWAGVAASSRTLRTKRDILTNWKKTKLFWVLSTASFPENTDKRSKTTLPSKGTQSMNVGLNPSPLQQVKLFQGNKSMDSPPQASVPLKEVGGIWVNKKRIPEKLLHTQHNFLQNKTKTELYLEKPFPSTLPRLAWSRESSPALPAGQGGGQPAQGQRGDCRIPNLLHPH